MKRAGEPIAKRRMWAAVVACLASCPLPAAALPSCAGPVEAANVQIVRVERDGVLVLTDGRAVSLEGLKFPAGSADRAPQFLAQQAIDTLNDLARGRHVTLSVFVPKEDRYGRLRAQVFFDQAADEGWLQTALLRRGFARVSIAPDRTECAAELYAAENYARTHHYGIWASSDYAVRRPDGLDNAVGTFQIVEGVVLSARVKSGRAYLDFTHDWRTGFKVTISPEDMGHFRDAGVDPTTYEGLKLRVRGFVDRMGGPDIEIANPQEMEVIQGP